ncbi:methyl-accepting chemotaxis protein [Plesiomonas shigelloides]|uniref:methyl-accepting chemotaxis protein n=1 Tax=Plesiomonas shigelloides TaxID=703 RepID=UPI001261E117|nr:methyl-accepting chemotaxis protein [Plesiomonas shigelloides]KAB7681614.1 HAMP domain-containing protein [Plesiomonas shigelloides]KAB7703056.1 HAMP domain-containing protein [Plesiomonas shigelloides]
MFNLSIRNRLFLSFSVLCVLIFIVGVYSLLKIRHLNKSIDELANISIPVMDYASDINKSAASSRRYILALFGRRDDFIRVEEYKKELDKSNSEMYALLKKKNEIISSSDELAIMRDIENLWDEFCSVNVKVIEDIKNENSELAMVNLNKGSVIYNKLHGKTKELTDISVNKAIHASSVAESIYSSAKYSIILSLIVSSALVCMFALLITRSITKPLTMMLEQAKSIANGDLTRSQLCEYIEMVERGKATSDELSDLGKELRRMKEGLHNLIRNIAESASQVTYAVEQVNMIAEQAAEGLAQQQSEVSQLAAAMNEMQATVQDVSVNTAHAASSAQDASNQSICGNDIVCETVSSIRSVSKQIEQASIIVQQLEQDSSSISVVLDVIRNIADQTNLLALNAAIEAARAGEQGRGFAVVADEVRTLAQKTQDSTTQINHIIEALQQRASEACHAMEVSCKEATHCVDHAQCAGDKIKEINIEISKISDMSAQIATATEEQSAVAAELNKNIINISEASNAVSNGATETTKACGSLLELSEQLNAMVRKFKM